MAARLLDKQLRYVAERFYDENSGAVDEIVIGKNAFFHISGENFSVLSESETLFSSKIIDLSMAELLSLEGVVLEGFCLVKNKNRQIVAYYIYHRK